MAFSPRNPATREIECLGQGHDVQSLAHAWVLGQYGLGFRVFRLGVAGGAYLHEFLDLGCLHIGKRIKSNFVVLRPNRKAWMVSCAFAASAGLK